MSLFDWTSSPKWSHDHKAILLEDNEHFEPTPYVTLSQLEQKSQLFPIKFPIDSVRCHQLRKQTSPDILEKNINSTYPIIHEYGLYLCSIFLSYQRKFGERADFYKKITLLDLIERFLSKRAVSFMAIVDHYLLINKAHGRGGWEKVGTKDETPPLVLTDVLSYDEMKLSALLAVSGGSYFINDGSRTNSGVFNENREEIEENGVIIGLIGPRLEKPGVMECTDILKTRDFCYGKLQREFLNFYGGLSDSYDVIEDELKRNSRYVDLGNGIYFDNDVYSKRLSLSIDVLLWEANERALRAQSSAYIHVVGLGLGVWRISAHQKQVFMDTFAQRLELLAPSLTHVSDVRFAYISETKAGRYKDGDLINGIRIHIANVNPQCKLTDGKLLIVSYPWDGNALPGNEFWWGSLRGSGDPAAACSSQVAELHNWHINGNVGAANLRVATFEGVVTFKQYQELHK